MIKLLLSFSILSLTITFSFAQSALSFGSNNTNTYVTFGNKPALGLAQFTVECWFKRTGTGITASTGTGGVTAAIPLVTKGTSESDGSTVDANYFIGINTSGNKLCADFEEGAGGTSPGLNHPITGTTVISNNIWYHAAATYDGSTWKLYLNGLLEATLVVNQPCQNFSIQHSSIGSSIQSNGTTAQGFFAGVIDETRIWNSARTISQIQSTANNRITSPQTGLVARWGLDEGSGTFIGDISGNSLSGTIVGTNYTWTTNVAPFNLPFNSPPVITVNTPANNAKCLGGGSVNLNVSVADPNLTDVLTVKFYGQSITTNSPFPLLATYTVTGSGNVSYIWSDLLNDSTFHWYASVADTQYTVTTATNNFSTFAGPVVNLGSDVTLACGQQITLDAANSGKNYLWSNGATMQTITASFAGKYYVRVTNPISTCFGTDTIQISYVSQPTVTITTGSITPTCQGGITTLTATAGMSAYAWSTGETTQAISATIAGTYSVLVTDNGACQNTAIQSVTFAPTVTATVSATNVSCNGGANGLATATGIGGTPPYSYLWSNGATSQSISSLTANVYSVTVTDHIGCTITKTVTVTQPAVLSLNSPTIVTTNGGYNGTITANPTGGTSPYTYSWRYTNGGANITTQALSATHVGGIYSVTVTDNKGCKAGGNYSHAIPVVATSTVLVPWSSTWKYKDDGSNQGAAWKGISFDDSGWSSGQAEFGYGDGDETTLINACGAVTQTPSCSNKYITTYLRKNITVTDPTMFQNIKFNVFRDDGIIVYVNNNEVYRSNMPTTAITYTTGASTAVSDDGETLQTQAVALASSFFVAGNNTIAVEVHQQVGTSSDVTFNMEILGMPPVPEALTRGPYLQKLTSSSITIKWSTDMAVKSQINYGTDSSSLSSSVSDNNLVNLHSLVLTGLSPYTKYYYSVGSPTYKLQGNGQNFFITAPVVGTEGQYNFWLVGDCGNNSTNQMQVRDRYNAYMSNKATNGWLLLGDNAYTNGTDAEYQAEFFNVYQGSILKHAPLYPAPGNHDYNNGGVFNHSVPYYTLFDMPSNGEAGGVPSGTKAYYSYDYGNAHFLSLDSYGKEDGVHRLYDTTGQQVQWIKQDLAANTNKKFIIAYWHHPPYTMGSHNSDTEDELLEIRKNFIRILERYGVDLIVCGHSHDYERSKLMKGNYGLETTFNVASMDVSTSNGRYDGTINSCTYVKDSIHGYAGTIYVVAGSAGQLDGGAVQSSFPHDAMNGFNNATNGGSGLLTIEGNRLDMKWICADGVIRDQFTLIKDANKRTQQTINYGQSVALAPSWKGQYLWSTGATTTSITVTPTVTTKYAVADQYQCVTDSFTIHVIMPTVTSSLNAVTLCPGTSVKIPFTTSGIINNGNTFTVQLSDASGSFANGVNIGALNATSSDTINAVIPASGIPDGSTYRIRVLASSPPITGSSSVSFAILTPTVTVFSSDNDNNICSGSSTTLTATDGFSNYLWSNGFTTQSMVVSAGGDFSVSGINNNGCSATSPALAITVSNLPTAVIIPGGTTTTFCQGGSVMLTATDNMNLYLWSNGATTSSVNINSAGNFSVTVTDANGCNATSNPISVVVNGLPTPNITPGSSTTFCQGVSVVLTANNGMSSYLWSNGATTQAITISSTGGYNVHVTDSNGCSANADSINIITTSIPVAIISPSGNVVFCAGDSIILTATDNANTYLWSNGKTTQSITVKIPGNYSVSVSNNGCSDISSATIVTMNSLPSDIDKDGITRNEDLLLMLAKYNQFCLCPEDINKDGIVDTIDFLVLLAQYNQVCH